MKGRREEEERGQSDTKVDSEKGGGERGYSATRDPKVLISKAD